MPTVVTAMVTMVTMMVTATMMMVNELIGYEKMVAMTTMNMSRS